MFAKLCGSALCAVAFARAQSHSQMPLSLPPPHTAEQNATIFSLIYGIPLTQYVIFGDSIADKSDGEWKTNAFNHETTLANASYHTIVLPNVDTVYSEALIDLSETNVVATMPPLEEGRFYVWPFYDVYGNNFCNLGTTKNHVPGKYLITYRPSNPGCNVASRDGEYVGVIHMPTPYGASLLRIEVNNSSDVDYVVSSIQPNFTLSIVPTSRPYSAPLLTRGVLNDCLNSTDLQLYMNGTESVNTTAAALYLMRLTARLAAFNPPEVATDTAWVQLTLRLAGIHNGYYSTPAGVNVSLALSAASTQIAAVKRNDFEDLGHGWASLPPHLSADFHSNYDVRAFVALKGYMEVTSDDALYPTYSIDGHLYSNQSYLVQFFGKPQVYGFWSLTMYDGPGYLVPNDGSVYSLNNRDDITYPDGTLVRSTPADSSASFYMLLQSTSYPIAPRWKSNWLPTPADDAQFKFIFRLYGPAPSLILGNYTYPLVTPVDHNPPLPTTTAL
ncbi:hypothetical protein B0H16DRAFT_1451349 [Mycena metata]|uniref:Uncharacterized protein n=1 Tax=Mycena metata TaxID=1033252 RepID=A0AAD7JUX3_9AGAR|nr:hypothetical protein B0H16DRAFT_1451349 [Mycena metata]